MTKAFGLFASQFISWITGTERKRLAEINATAERRCLMYVFANTSDGKIRGAEKLSDRARYDLMKIAMNSGGMMRDLTNDNIAKISSPSVAAEIKNWRANQLLQLKQRFVEKLQCPS